MASFLLMTLGFALVPSSLADCSVSHEYGDIQYCVKDTTPGSYAQLVDDCRLEDAEPFFPQNRQHVDFVRENLLIEMSSQSTMWLGAYVLDGKIYSASSALLDISSLTFLTWKTALSEVSAVTGFRALQMNMEGEVFLAGEQDASLALCQKHLQLQQNKLHKRNPDERCPPYWMNNEAGNTCYFVNTEKLSWLDAKKHCGMWTLSVNMIIINNQEENNNLANILSTYGFEETWIGLKKGFFRIRCSDESIENAIECRRHDWYWQSQHEYTSSFKAWGDDQPAEDRHQYAKFNASTATWSTAGDGTYLMSICEMDITVEGSNIVYMYINYTVSNTSGYEDHFGAEASNLIRMTNVMLYFALRHKIPTFKTTMAIEITVMSQEIVRVVYRFEGSPNQDVTSEQFMASVNAQVLSEIESGDVGFIASYYVMSWNSSFHYTKLDDEGNLVSDVGSLISSVGDSFHVKRDVYGIVFGTLFGIMCVALLVGGAFLVIKHARTVDKAKKQKRQEDRECGATEPAFPK